MTEETNYKDIVNNFNNFKTRLKRYNRTRLTIKIFMNGLWIFLLFINLFAAFVVWFLFAPDIHNITKFIKKWQNT